ncbi:hypothetical protein BC567DRAFT_227794 [Phyllosticta citribraziliensis]
MAGGDGDGAARAGGRERKRLVGHSFSVSSSSSLCASATYVFLYVCCFLVAWRDVVMRCLANRLPRFFLCLPSHSIPTHLLITLAVGLLCRCCHSRRRRRRGTCAR